MTYVVAEPCVKCKYTDCVDVCPVDCFYEGENFLVIHPDECIDCGACEPACPWEAIFEDKEVPEIFEEDTQLNAQIFEDHDESEFTLEVTPIKRGPTADEVEANRQHWGYKK